MYSILNKQRTFRIYILLHIKNITCLFLKSSNNLSVSLTLAQNIYLRRIYTFCAKEHWSKKLYKIFPCVDAPNLPQAKVYSQNEVIYLLKIQISSFKFESTPRFGKIEQARKRLNKVIAQTSK